MIIANDTSFLNDSARLSPNWSMSYKSLNIWYGFTMVEGIHGGLLLAVMTLNGRLRTGSGFLIGHLTLLDVMISAVYSTINATVTFKLMAFHADHGVVDRFCGPFEFLYRTTRNARYWAGCLLPINRLIAIQFPESYVKVS